MNLAPMTSGHFLVVHALTAVPEPAFVDQNITPASCYRHVTKMRDDFWRRWTADYLRTLLPRTRWQDAQTRPRLNSLVLIFNKYTPPGRKKKKEKGKKKGM